MPDYLFFAERFFSVGLHPWNVEVDYILKETEIVRKYAELPTCLAIGETGLDRLAPVLLDLQKEVF